VKRILTLIDERFEEIIGVIVLAVVVSLIFIGVMMRLLFKSGLPWQEEISRMLYVLVVYLGASYGMRSNDHIRISIVSDLLSPRTRKALRVITDIIWAGFNITVIIMALQVYQKMQRFLGESAVLKIPLHVVFLIVPFGFALLTLRLVQGYIRGDPLSDPNPGNQDDGGAPL
jgi:TRAP-type C4-dicarboxylate transport system permease small subunit